MQSRTIVYSLLATSILATCSFINAAHACGDNCPQSVDPANISAGAKAKAQAVGLGGHSQATASSAPSSAVATAAPSSAVATSAPSSATSGPMSMQDNSNSETRVRALGLSFAPGAFTPPMAAIPCGGTVVEQSATGVGFGAFSRADSKADGSDCTMINVRNAKVEACQYASAKQIEDLVVAKRLPGYVPTPNTFRDLSTEECIALKNPAPAAANVSQPAVETPKHLVTEAVVDPAPVVGPKPRPAGTPCARPNGIRKADGLCYYPKADPCLKK